MTFRRDRPIFPGGRTPSDLPPLIRVDPRTLAYFGVILVLVWLAGWLYLHQASEAASYAHEIRDLMRSKEQLRREMIALRSQVALQGSLHDLRAIGQEWEYSLPSASDPRRRLLLEVTAEGSTPNGSAVAPVAPSAQSRPAPLPRW